MKKNILINFIFIPLLLIIIELNCYSQIYVSPVAPGTDEWKSITSYTDRIKACNIPEDILLKMSTKDLFLSVLKFPYSHNLGLLDNLQYSFYNIYNNYNGLKELYERKDFFNVIFNYYQEIDAEKSKGLTIVLENMLSQMKLLDILDKKDLNLILDETLQKFNSKSKSRKIDELSIKSGCLLLARLLYKLEDLEFKNKIISNNKLKEFIENSECDNETILGNIILYTIKYKNNN